MTIIRIWKRSGLLGRRVLVREFIGCQFECVISSAGVLTIRREYARGSVLALAPGEWTIAEQVEI